MANTLRADGREVLENQGEHGGHGFGLGIGTDVEGWVEEAAQFWEAHR